MKIDELKKMIEKLSEREAKSLLLHVFTRLDLMKETDYSESEFIYDIEKIFKAVNEITSKQSEFNESEAMDMVHILFGESQAGGLKVALKEMGLYEKEKVIFFSDQFSIGPVWRLHEEAGKKARFHWMKNVTKFEDFDLYKQRFKKTVHQILSIPEGVPITIWTADNAHEQTGLRYVLFLLKKRKNDFSLINTTKVFREFYRKKEVKYTALHSGEIPPEKLHLIYEQGHAQALTESDREELEKVWLVLSNHQDQLRLWRNRKIQHVQEDYFDSFIINKAKKLHSKQESKDFMKSARLIGEVFGHLDQYVGDEFLEYRLRKLIEKGIFEVQGSLKAMRYYSVRLKD